MKSSRAELIYHTDWLVYDVYLKIKKEKRARRFEIKYIANLKIIHIMMYINMGEMFFGLKQ